MNNCVLVLGLPDTDFFLKFIDCEKITFCNYPVPLNNFNNSADLLLHLSAKNFYALDFSAILDRWLGLQRIDEELKNQVLIAGYEAFSNALMWGHLGLVRPSNPWQLPILIDDSIKNSVLANLPLTISLHLAVHSIKVQITSRGPINNWYPSANSPSYKGLGLIKALCSDWHYEDQCTTLIFRRDCNELARNNF